jgi:hypothetical protein
MGNEAASGGLIRFVPRSNREETDDGGGVSWFVVGAVLLLILVSLLPFLAVAWMLSRTLRGVKKRVSWD